MILTYLKAGGCLVPADHDTIAFHNRFPGKAIMTCDFMKKNNYEFHKKLMALANCAFEHWEPGEVTSKHGTPVKNYKRFRKDITILAGYFDLVIRTDGSAVPEAHSWSFGNMSGEKREKFYQDILTVIMEKIYPDYAAKNVEKMAEQYWNELLSYA